MEPISLLKDQTETSKASADEYLKIAPLFKLGKLPTECPHPTTIGLSSFIKSDLPLAINKVKELDIHTIEVLISKIGELEPLFKAITQTLDAGNKIFICGCGATGRLSLALETMWRQEIEALWGKTDPKLYARYFNSVISFMAGGDVALIKSVEDFEDHPEFGERQLFELGFSENDLLISSTEGGETPWVIGTSEAVANSYGTKFKQKPWFLYCNPDDVLIANVERSKRVIENPNICKINVTVGPMAITGSTRMQSTTILMYAIGLPMFRYHLLRKDTKPFQESVKEELVAFLDLYSKLDEAAFLAPFITKEAETYQYKDHFFYKTDPYFAISILTDTTERSPTFSLFPFENQSDPPTVKVPSLCHLILLLPESVTTGLKDEDLVKASWTYMLGKRDVRALNGPYWEKYKEKVSSERLFGHDFSYKLIPKRREYARVNAKHHTFLIEKKGDRIHFCMLFDGPGKEISKEIDVKSLGGSRLAEHTLVKILLNTHSTLVMGKYGRYESNIMIFVRPSNNKLIDRAIRYVTYMLNQRKEELCKIDSKKFDLIDYKLVCNALFAEIETLVYDEAIVLKTFNRICKDLFSIAKAV